MSMEDTEREAKRAKRRELKRLWKTDGRVSDSDEDTEVDTAAHPTSDPPEGSDILAQSDKEVPQRVTRSRSVPPQNAQPQRSMVRPVAGPARMRKRHFGLLLSFLLVVVVPSAVAAYYLWVHAEDQYASTVGFSVRKEEGGSAVDILGGLTQISNTSSSDTDVLYSFMQSQELVHRIDAELDLRKLYSRHFDRDPVFSLRPGGTIEDLLDYWGRMVKIFYDPGTGLIEIRVLSFDPDESRKIAERIFEESSAMINRLSAIARDDATRYALEDLDQAVERLKAAREATTAFRNRTQIVDPRADILGQVGLLNTLQAQLAEALIELDLLRETARDNDPRITQAERRIDVIGRRISAERRKFGGGAGNDADDEDYASLVAEFERLAVDLDFAEQAYKSALSAYDGARAEAQRQSRYLAAHIKPTRAESSRFPQREMLLGLTLFFLFLAWSILALIYYSIRDRR